MIKKDKVKPSTPKKKGEVTNLIIIDASGSMASKEAEVKGGLKQLLSDIKTDAKKDKNTKISTIVVDFSSGNDFNVLVNSKDSKDLDDKIGDKYTTRGMTALYDAIGKGFQLVDSKAKSVFVTIITDGEENSSQEYSGKDVNDLMDKHKKKGWALTFMGTTQASIAQAKNWGISPGNTMAFADNARGVGQTFTLASNARKAHYNMTVTNSVGAEYMSMKGKKLTATKDDLLQSQVDQGEDLDLDKTK